MIYRLHRSPNRFNSSRGNTKILFVVVALISIFIGLYVQTAERRPAELPEFSNTILLPKPRALSDFEFTSHLQQEFTKADLLGKWSLLFFGFTNCPDICPTTLQTLSQTKQELAASDAWQNLQVVMVSVDPERDTVERLAKYVPWFDEEFIGITAPVEQTKAFAKQMNVPFIKANVQSEQRYEVDHYAGIILVNPLGEYAGVISAPHTKDDLVADISKLLNYSDKLGFAEALANESSSSAETAMQTQVRSELEVSNAWIRPAPPNAPAMAAYFDIKNISDKPITLIGASAPAFGMTEIHNTVVEDGVAKMLAMPKLTLAPGETAEFKPMGKHVMLMRPQHILSLGTVTTIDLLTDDGSTYPINIEVKPNPKQS